MDHLENILFFPPQNGECELCRVAHEPHLPHVVTSPHYIIRYYKDHGRYPTQEDAMDHCDEIVRVAWIHELEYWKGNIG